jgi:hypothetical protein
MAGYDFPQALEMQGLLRQFVMNHAGGCADDAALCTIHDLCGRLVKAADDSTCRQAIERIEGLAANLFSAENHRHWDRPGQSGILHLKQLILRELIGLRLRLRRIEAAEIGAQAAADPSARMSVEKSRARSIQ